MAKPNALQSALRNAAEGRKPATAAPTPAPKAEAAPSRATKQAKAAVQASRQGTSGITVHYPDAVRRQLKMLAAETGRTMDDLVAEGLNLMFAKHRKPEIAPRKGGKPA